MVTQTRPFATVSACGLPPTVIVVGLSVMGLMCVTVPSPLLATHTDPPPTATPAGERPTGMIAATDHVSGSIRTTVSLSESTTQTPPAPAAIAVGPLPTGIGLDQASPVDADDVPGVSVGEPHRPLADSDTRRAAFGSTGCPCTRPVSASRRVSRPFEGATHTEWPCGATAPGAPGTRLAICTGRPGYVELGVDPADGHAALGRIGIRLDHPHPVGARGKRRPEEREHGMLRTVRRLVGSTREIV